MTHYKQDLITYVNYSFIRPSLYSKQNLTLWL